MGLKAPGESVLLDQFQTVASFLTLIGTESVTGVGVILILKAQLLAMFFPREQSSLVCVICNTRDNKQFRKTFQPLYLVLYVSASSQRRRLSGNLSRTQVKFQQRTL